MKRIGQLPIESHQDSRSSGAPFACRSACDGDAPPGGRGASTGLFPGDESYPEPYWYVSPWPYPLAAALPPVRAASHWHTEGFTAAVLTGSDPVGGAPEGQADRVRAFLGDAIEASRRALGESAD